MTNTSEFDPEIHQIEREIVGFFAEKASEYAGRHPIVAMVLSYFYIHRNLTQRDLRTLTGFSAGAISKALHQLVDMNMITREMISGTHMHLYKMETLPFGSPQYLLQTEKTLEKQYVELTEMMATLDAQCEEMRNIETYQKVYAIVTHLLKQISSVPRFMTLIEKELDNFLKKESEKRQYG